MERDKFAKLTNRAPRLGDFIPCDEDENVLEKPIDKAYSKENAPKEFDEYVPIYRAAQDRVIFSGDWELVAGSNCVISNGELMLRFIGDVTDIIRKGLIEKSINRIEELPREIEFKENAI